eukprot:gene5575-7700_t
MSESDFHEVERFLLKIDDSFDDNENECTIQLEIQDVGCWYIKFRKFGVILNNKDLVYSDIITKDASIFFKTNGIFWQTVNGGSSIEEEVSKNHIKQSGKSEALDMFRRKCIKSTSIRNNVNNNDNLNENQFSPTNNPLRQHRLPSNEGIQPLKSGWLLKKRDIISGWRCRYFVVYVGRVEYYKDEHDTTPRGVIQLTNAEVNPARKVYVNGIGEYWGITVDTKMRDKTLRLASEFTGDEGMVDAHTWEQVFKEASKEIESNNTLSTTKLITDPSNIPENNNNKRNKKIILPPITQTSSTNQNNMKVEVEYQETSGGVVHRRRSKTSGDLSASDSPIRPVQPSRIRSQTSKRDLK